MEVLYGFLGMGEMGEGFPSVFLGLSACPVYQVDCLFLLLISSTLYSFCPSMSSGGSAGSLH